MLFKYSWTQMLMSFTTGTMTLIHSEKRYPLHEKNETVIVKATDKFLIQTNFILGFHPNEVTLYLNGNPHWFSRWPMPILYSAVAYELLTCCCQFRQGACFPDEEGMNPKALWVLHKFVLCLHWFGLYCSSSKHKAAQNLTLQTIILNIKVTASWLLCHIMVPICKNKLLLLCYWFLELQELYVTILFQSSNII